MMSGPEMYMSVKVGAHFSSHTECVGDLSIVSPRHNLNRD